MCHIKLAQIQRFLQHAKCTQTHTQIFMTLLKAHNVTIMRRDAGAELFGFISVHLKHHFQISSSEFPPLQLTAVIALNQHSPTMVFWAGLYLECVLHSNKAAFMRSPSLWFVEIAACAVTPWWVRVYVCVRSPACIWQSGAHLIWSFCICKPKMFTPLLSVYITSRMWQLLFCRDTSPTRCVWCVWQTDDLAP